MLDTIIVIVAVIILIIGWRWLSKKNYQQLINWLKKGALHDDKPYLTGFWREIADYISRVLKQKDQENQNNIDQLNKLLVAIKVSPNGVLLLDRDYKIDWCNDMAAQHFTLNPKLDLQQHITNLIRYPEFITYLELEDYQIPLTLTLGQEEQKIMIRIHSYDEGRLLLLSSDITQLDRVDKMRRNFVADVSHEIRTPLTVLSGFVETMQTLPLEETEKAHFLDLMQQQTGRMQSLINDLLTLARLEDSPTPPTDQWVSVKDILKHTKDTVQELSSGKHHIVVNLTSEAFIAGIESELISAVTNIAINAVRYTKEGGDISISFEMIEGQGIFKVKDSGEGIAQIHIKNLTQRFYRVDKSRSRETGGTGLGLSIVKHVILRHGGNLTIESVEGKGSTFSIILPAQRIKI